MRSTITSPEEFLGACHWEQLRSLWFERQHDNRMAAHCLDLALEYQRRLERLEAQADG